MKILHVASGDFFSTYGGGQVYVKNVVDEMIRQRLDVSVLSYVSKESSIVELNYKDISLWEVGTLATQNQIYKLISSLRPIVIHTHSNELMFCSLANQLHIPVVVTAHHGGILCPAGALMNAEECICQTLLSHEHCLKCCLANICTGRSWYPLMKLLPQKGYTQLGKALEKLPFIPFITPIGGVALSIENKIKEWQTICEKVTKVIAPSNAIAEAMCRNGLSREKVEVIPHGIPKASPAVIEKKKDDIIRFFYVGRICRIKGLHVLLEAFTDMANSEKAELHIIGGAGNKGEQRYMEGLQSRYKADNIVWHGKVPAEKVFDTIKEFDVMVHPTICMEIYGLNIAEALVMNKPVLATRCGGAEMQIIDGENGWLVAPNNVNALRTKMNEIVESGVAMDVNSLHMSVVTIDEHVNDLLIVYEKETSID